MPNSVTLAQAKDFLRVGGEDELVSLLIEAAEARVGQAAGVGLSAASPAPLRLAVLILACHAYEHRGDARPPPLSLVEPWLAPYREARL
ncbi:phage gp6-like head-tail connector protein [Caulobacter zeae]|uniref:Phage gp6-like head-tail connector protein n=1 Tax=Caulobacter zeae TaxID=2055137 RepID=A0A2N5DGJ4_9CAUL|nr:head-tail connector protein [Caulobacter zeae]PLR25161.1 phage gp6-like head-tail connector protein [Caulobacter zeae]